MDLRDLRAKVTVEADAALDAASRATGRDRSEIVRDVLHAWALDEIHKATLLLRKLKAEGIAAPDSGDRGRV
jgi:predicted MarR family transcription regulator